MYNPEEEPPVSGAKKRFVVLWSLFFGSFIDAWCLVDFWDDRIPEWLRMCIPYVSPVLFVVAVTLIGGSNPGLIAFCVVVSLMIILHSDETDGV